MDLLMVSTSTKSKPVILGVVHLVAQVKESRFCLHNIIATDEYCVKGRSDMSESSLSGHEAGLGLFSRCPGDDPVHQTRDTSRAVPAHICNGNAGLEHTKALVRNPLCKAGGLSFNVL